MNLSSYPVVDVDGMAENAERKIEKDNPAVPKGRVGHAVRSIMRTVAVLTVVGASIVAGVSSMNTSALTDINNTGTATHSVDMASRGGNTGSHEHGLPGVVTNLQKASKASIDAASPIVNNLIILSPHYNADGSIDTSRTYQGRYGFSNEPVQLSPGDLDGLTKDLANQMHDDIGNSGAGGNAVSKSLNGSFSVLDLLSKKNVDSKALVAAANYLKFQVERSSKGIHVSVKFDKNGEVDYRNLDAQEDHVKMKAYQRAITGGGEYKLASAPVAQLIEHGAQKLDSGMSLSSYHNPEQVVSVPLNQPGM